jgi:hypothetical protein
VRDCLSALPPGNYAVRSDAACEDRACGSQAGRFLSLLEVTADQLGAAIEEVMASLPGAAADAVLVQPMLGPSRRVGVASTHRINDGAPWYCIEFGAGDSAAVTAGRATGRQLAWSRAAVAAGRGPDADGDAAAVLGAMREIEAWLPGQPFEIEFLLLPDVAPPQLLQVRPLATTARWSSLSGSAGKGRAPPFGCDPDYALRGSGTLYSLMSDWNPAELIGTCPRPLALGLFRACIADGTWWNARRALGYQAPPAEQVPLLRNVYGRPYVDLRRSANSLLPADLPAPLGDLLVDRWIERLRRRPELHDKVEFEVFCTTRDLRSPASFDAEYRALLGADGARLFESRLRHQTATLMQRSLKSLCPTLHLLSRGSTTAASWSTQLRLCRQAAFEFAQLARIAFVAEAQLRSAVQLGALAPQRALDLRLGAGTLGNALADAAPAMLRPSSFDIAQPLWCGSMPMPMRQPGPGFALQAQEARAVGRLLADCGLPDDAARWAQWVAAATLAREWGKYALNLPLAALIECIAGAGKAIGLDREALSWLDLGSCRELLEGRISAGAAVDQGTLARRRAQRAQRWPLGPVLACEADLERFDSLGVLPNFIGREVGQGPLRVLSSGHPDQEVNPGDMVAVLHADPGFDWLFERNIGGLVTAWGGAHSHMGIRCAEHGLPAALGCGEAVWSQLQRARSARIDPQAAALWLY